MGHDQALNLVFSHTIEGIFANPGSEEAMQQAKQGLYLIRGDIVAPSRRANVRLGVGIDWWAVRRNG